LVAGFTDTCSVCFKIVAFIGRLHLNVTDRVVLMQKNKWHFWLKRELNINTM